MVPLNLAWGLVHPAPFCSNGMPRMDIEAVCKWRSISLFTQILQETDSDFPCIRGDFEELLVLSSWNILITVLTYVFTEDKLYFIVREMLPSSCQGKLFVILSNFNKCTLFFKKVSGRKMNIQSGLKMVFIKILSGWYCLLKCLQDTISEYNGFPLDSACKWLKISL